MALDLGSGWRNSKTFLHGLKILGDQKNCAEKRARAPPYARDLPDDVVTYFGGRGLPKIELRYGDGDCRVSVSQS